MAQQGVDILHLPETTTTNENDAIVKQNEATTLTEKIKVSNFFNFIKTQLNIITSILSTSSNNEIPTAKAVIDFATEEIRKNASTFRGSWNNWTSVPSDYTLYPADISGNKKPEINDIIIINDASDYTEETLTGTWRFRYAGEWDTDGKDGWVKEYQIEVDMEEYVEKTTTIAGIDLQDNITAQELETGINKQTSITSSSTNSQLGSAKAVYDLLKNYIVAQFDREHPVNSTYIQTPGCPDPNTAFNDDFITSTWQKDTIYDNKALWVDSTKTAGTSIAGGLPNITGAVFARNVNLYYGFISNSSGAIQDGAFYTQGDGVFTQMIKYGENAASGPTRFDASKSNNTYGKTTIVRPESFSVVVWKRVS